MGRLGYDRWGAQGGDWGAGVTTVLGYKAPPGLVGIHLNMAMFQPTDDERANATPEEQAMLDAAQLSVAAGTRVNLAASAFSSAAPGERAAGLSR